MSLSKDQILQAQDIKTEKVFVPEWGGEVNVKTLTGEERDRFEQSLFGDKSEKKMNNIRAKLCAASIVDDAGKQIFTEADIAAIGGKSANALDAVFAVAQRLSGLSKSDVDALVKNSESGQSEDSTSL
jgi:hypothetical protein